MGKHSLGGNDVDPSQVDPQGEGSGLDADLVDGMHASAIGGMWTEDSNSPHTATGVTDTTVTLGETWDRVLVLVESTDQASSTANDWLQVNGDTGANYSSVAYDGTHYTGANEVNGIIARGVADVTEWFWFSLTGRWNERWYGVNLSGGGPGSRNTWYNGSVADPLSSIRLGRGVATDYNIRIFGRND